MPLYKNNTAVKQMLDGKAITPGGVMATFTHHDIEGKGIQKVSEAPAYNPVILSEVIDKPSVLKVPERDKAGYFVDKFVLHFYVEAGLAKVTFNTEENNPPLLLYKDARWNIRVYDRKVDKIFIKQASADTLRVFVIIEKLTS